MPPITGSVGSTSLSGLGGERGPVSLGPDPSSWSCPAPLLDHTTVVLGHGGGGRPTAELVEPRPFLPLPAAANRLGSEMPQWSV